MGGLTTHVLDTANGKPAMGVRYELFRLGERRESICQGQTNADGRTDKPLLDDRQFAPGSYELVFAVGSYFDASPDAQVTPFLDHIPIRFSLTADQHYHVPLLVSPWSYSTYRGS